MVLGLIHLAVYTKTMNNVFSITRPACIILLLGIIAGCESLPHPHHEVIGAHADKATIDLPDPLTQQTISTLIPPQTSATEIVPSLLPTDTLYSLLVAEVAASRRQYDTAINNYVDQAKETGNKAIIIRATRIAQFLRAHHIALDMGLLWLNKEPANNEALSAVANAHIELQQPLQAVKYIEQLMTELAFARVDVKRNDGTKKMPNRTDGGALIETLANFNRQSDNVVLEALISKVLPLAGKFTTSAGVRVGLSTLYQAVGDHQSARRWIDQALDSDPTRTSAIVQDIRLLQSTQKNVLALTKLREYVSKVPDNQRLRLIYARSLSQSDIKESYTQFTILSKQSPTQLDLRFSRALLATELELMDVARPLFESLLDENYQPDSIRFYLGHIYDFQEQTDTALNYYLAVTQGDHFLSARYRAASVYLEQEKIEAAVSLFDDLHKQFPDKTELLFESQASLLVKYQANPQAIKLLNSAIVQFPDNTILRYERATLFERKNLIDLMEQDFRHVLTLKPNDVATLNGLGYLLTLHTQRYDEAYLLISKALSLSPDDAAIIDSMGWALFKLGRLDESIGYLRQAYEKHPNAEIAAHLGEALWEDGQQDAAKQVWQESLAKEPNALDIPKALQRLGIEQPL
ncbi:MAG: tetratricopeptide (TPR) repeat protein [Candidatus Endobugula sp.]|jgi:tetratricopeptide (TPR) repeat protein